MQGFNKIEEIAEKLRRILIGQISQKYKATITDVFVSSEQWTLTREVYKKRKFMQGFPFKEGDNLTLVVELDNHTLEGISDVVNQDEFTQWLPLIEGLPYMLNDRAGNDSKAP